MKIIPFYGVDPFTGEIEEYESSAHYFLFGFLTLPPGEFKKITADIFVKEYKSLIMGAIEQ